MIVTRHLCCGSAMTRVRFRFLPLLTPELTLPAVFLRVLLEQLLMVMLCAHRLRPLVQPLNLLLHGAE